MWGELMDLEDARVGTRVRVLLDYKEPHQQGSVGTIKKRYGMPNYRVFEVLLPDGRMELFWDHQLEEAPLRSKRRRWVFW